MVFFFNFIKLQNELISFPLRKLEKQGKKTSSHTQLDSVMREAVMGLPMVLLGDMAAGHLNHG